MAAQARNSRFLMTLVAVGLVVAVVFVLSSGDRSSGDAGMADGSASSAPGADAQRFGPAESQSGQAGGNAVGSGVSGGASAPAAGSVEAQSGAAVDPSRVPIPVPADFVDVFESNEALAAFHAMLESEPEDSAWAQALESHFTSHFNGTLDLSEWRVQLIECRSTACEILATGYGDEAMRGWMQSLSELFENEEQFEALIGGPGNASCGGRDLAPGVFGVSCTIQRTEGEAAAGDAVPESETFSIDAPYPDDVSIERVQVPEFIVPAIESDRAVFDLHRRLEQETIDYAWAGYVEPLITEFLSGLDPERGLELLDVTCRSTLCEVQMVARNEEVAMVEWVSTMLDFMRTEGHGLMPGAANDETFGDGEETGIVWFLERGPEP